MKQAFSRGSGSGEVRLRGVLAAACAILITACTTGHSVAQARSGQFKTGSTSGYAAYRSASENRTFLSTAVEELTRRCMVKAGFQYWPVPILPAEYRDPARPLTVDEARARGYRALTPPADAPGSHERDAYLASLSTQQRQAYDLALGGNPDHRISVDTPAGRVSFPAEGCSAAADTQIFTDPDRYRSLDFLVANLTALPEYAPDTDPALKAATRSWAKCIATKGYGYASPSAAIAAAAQLDSQAAGSAGGLEPAVPAAPALAIAVADAECRVQTSWDRANAAAVRNAFAVVVDAHQADILSFNERAAAATKKARAILG